MLAASQPQPETITTVSFGYEEMLSELAAIVAEAEIRSRKKKASPDVIIDTGRGR
ncbi:MAG: hypothetical protein ACLR17_15165 [Enterobacteriaceae bacterium]